MAGALGVVITNDVPVEGRAAVPVYVDDSLPIVGPSQAIVVTTGEVPQMGGPPMAVRLAPAGTPAIGPALPVYVVSGALSSGPVVTPPVNTVLPAISGTPAPGQTLTTTDGTWTGTAPIVYTYQWKRGGVNIGGATNNTYLLTASDPGTTITVTVTATNTGGSASATSAGVAISSLHTGLLAYWKMEEASGNRLDSSGNGITLTPTNAPNNAPGIVGNSVALITASAQYLTGGQVLPLTSGSWSIDGWIRLTTISAVYTVASKYNSSGLQKGYLLFFDNSVNRMKLIVSPDGNTQPTVTADNFGALSVDTWYYIYAEKNGLSTIGISINGGTLNTTALTSNTFASTADFQIGAHAAGSAGRFNGRIDELEVHNRILTPTEITARYAGGAGLTYPFDGSRPATGPAVFWIATDGLTVTEINTYGFHDSTIISHEM